jgi:CHAD domain-containing protein
MKSAASRSNGKKDLAHEPDLEQRIEAWRDLLAGCARKPSRKRVHALRSTTLRLRTVLEFSLEGSKDKAALRTFGKWKKAAKKLRTALQPVRDRDVYLARLKSLEEPSGKRPEGQPKLSVRAVKEAEKLERRLKRRRKAGAKDLADKFEARGKKLKRLGKKIAAATGPLLAKRAGETGEAALQIFRGLAQEHSGLDGANMHEYRKRTKRALYLAEISSDSKTRKLTAALKKIHEAAGEWHDWQMLAMEAAKVLGRRKHKDGLVPVLEAMAEKALKNAIELCLSTESELLPEVEDNSGLPPRKPVASERGRPNGEYLDATGSG